MICRHFLRSLVRTDDNIDLITRSKWQMIQDDPALRIDRYFRDMDAHNKIIEQAMDDVGIAYLFWNRWRTALVMRSPRVPKGWSVVR